MEEDFIEQMCKEIIKYKPTVVFTEKGVSDLAQHYLVKAGISVIRRIRKTDNNRISRASGATICHETNEIVEKDIGVGCGLFEIKKIGDEYFTYLIECKDPKACTVVLRGGSKDVLNEMERNLLDAMNVVRNVFFDNRVVVGGGAAEMAIGRALLEKSKSINGPMQWPYRAIATALEVIPRTLVENCGASTIRLMTALRAEYAETKYLESATKITSTSSTDGKATATATSTSTSTSTSTASTDAKTAKDTTEGKAAAAAAAPAPDSKTTESKLPPLSAVIGIDGNKGEIANMFEKKILDPFLVKSQTYKTAIEAACMLLRIDDIVSGMSKGGGSGGGGGASSGHGDEETSGETRED